MSKATKYFISLFLVLFVILFFLVLRTPSNQLSSLLGENVSIRQQDGKVQWKFAGSNDWQTITTVSELTGQKGDIGAKGEQGGQGEKGKDGPIGARGVQGDKGDTGATGQAGVVGDRGIRGVAGINGQDGVNGINGTNGTDGREIELQKDLYYIQWRYVGEPGWRNLIAYSDLKGDKGDKGDAGTTGATGPANTLSIGSVTKPSDCIPTASITGTAPNQTLNLGIPGLPNGGTTGQVLTKNSGADCDAIWKDSGPQLLREIVWSGNDNALPTAVDLTTGIFTAAGHSLKESTGGTAMVTPRAGGMDFLPKYLPGGLPPNVHKFVTVVDADHFYLSNSKGGAAITYTSNPDMDLSKIKFEQNNKVSWSSGLSQYKITGLGDRNYVRVEIIGKNTLRYIYNGNNGGPTFIGGGDIYGSVNPSGFAYALANVIIDTRGDFLTLYSETNRWNYNTASAYTYSYSKFTTMNPNKPAEPFNQVVLDNGIMVDGTIIRIWDR